MTFNKGDRVILARPYMINGHAIHHDDTAAVVKVGTSATVVAPWEDEFRDTITVVWDGYEHLSVRRVDDSCLDPEVTEADLDEAIQSISRTLQERGGQ